MSIGLDASRAEVEVTDRARTIFSVKLLIVRKDPNVRFPLRAWIYSRRHPAISFNHPIHSDHSSASHHTVTLTKL